MASVRWLLTSLAFICLFALSRQECECDIELKKDDLDDGVKCDGKSDAQKCFEKCKKGTPLFGTFLRQLDVFEKAACKEKVEKEAKGKCWMDFFNQCKDLVPQKKEDETEKRCKEAKDFSGKCILQSDECPALRSKVAKAVVDMCGKGDAAQLGHLSTSLVLGVVVVFAASRWQV